MKTLPYTLLSPEEVDERVVAIVGTKPNQNPYVCYHCGSELRGYYGCAEEKLGVRPLCHRHGFVRPVYGDLTDEYDQLTPEQQSAMYWGGDGWKPDPNDVKLRIGIEEDWHKRFNEATKTIIKQERESRGIFEGRDQA